MLVPEPSCPPDADRNAVVAHLRRLVGEGRLDLDYFTRLTELAFAAPTSAALADVVIAAPSIVPLTPPERRHEEPLRIDVGVGELKLGGRWQLGERTIARVGKGQIIMDLSEAEWDARTIDLELSVEVGQIIVRVPPGVEVRFTELSANLVNKLPSHPAVPGAPLLRVRSRVRAGQVVFRPTRRRVLSRIRRKLRPF